LELEQEQELGQLGQGLLLEVSCPDLRVQAQLVLGKVLDQVLVLVPGLGVDREAELGTC
jgi:hypothetical protein